MNEEKYDTGPFSYQRDSEIAVIVIHGFLASSQQMYHITGELLKEGFSIEAPNLKGHGTVVEDLLGVTYSDWEAEIEELYLKLRELYSYVFIVGHSLGGQLALSISQKYNCVDGIVIINSAYDYRYSSIQLARVLKGIVRSIPMPPLSKVVKDPGTVGKFTYKRMPIKAALESFYLSQKTKGNMERSKVPTLIFKSTKDRYLRRNGRRMYRKIRAKEKWLVYLNNSFHDAVLDYDKEIISAKTVSFIKELSNSTSVTFQEL